MSELSQQTSDTTLLTINGMSCAGCVRSVESALATVPGVSLATVNFAGQTAAVTGIAKIESLVDAVQGAGYEAKLLEDESLEAQEKDVMATLKKAVAKSVFALAGGLVLMADMRIGYLPSLDATLVWSVLGGLTLVLMMLSGGHFFRGAWSALRHGATTMDTLIALGTGTAWTYSMFVILVPEMIPVESRHQFFEAALFVIGFVNLGKALEINARSKASLAIQKLFDLAPKFATLIGSDGDRLVPVEEVVVGNQLKIKPGEYFSVDGQVISGHSSVNEALLTGEAMPVTKQQGDVVSAGTLNIDGSLVIEAVGVGATTKLASIMRLVKEAQNSKPEIAHLVDRITAVFVPIVLVIAVVTAALWWLLGPEPRLSFALVTSMSVLIIACPCALGLAIPMSIMVGLGRGAADGLLIKNSEILQVASKLTIVVVDKTGTLTNGAPEIIEMKGLDQGQLSCLHALESRSEHPIARAIVEYCERDLTDDVSVQDFRNHVGGGVTGRVDRRMLVIGSAGFLQQQGVSGVPDIDEVGTLVCVAFEGEFAGHFLLRDEPRVDAAEMVSSLKRAGLRTVMLTGDRRNIAQSVAHDVGIDEVHAELLPEDKLNVIRQFQEDGELVGMVGDGINDAAALTIADVGFAMGMGADVAMESADVTLLSDSLGGIEKAISLSRLVLRNIYQNLVAAFAYNLLLIPVAAGVLYPFTGTLINPAMAGLAMAMSSVTVVFNAGRLRFS